MVNYTHMLVWRWNKLKETWQSGVTLFLKALRQSGGERRSLLCVTPPVGSTTCSLRNGCPEVITSNLDRTPPSSVVMMQAEEAPMKPDLLPPPEVWNKRSGASGTNRTNVHGSQNVSNTDGRIKDLKGSLQLRTDAENQNILRHAVTYSTVQKSWVVPLFFFFFFTFRSSRQKYF